MEKDLLNAKEISRYLNINEKKIYALAVANKIPCTKVTGKWIFPKKLIDEWILTTAEKKKESPSPAGGIFQNIIFHGSDDPLIGILAHKFKKEFPEYFLSICNVGGLTGLDSLKRGIAHIAGIPVNKRDKNDFKRAILGGMEVVQIHLANRKQGLIAASGNPRRIMGMTDLVNRDITYINRQTGSGTRILFDYELEKGNISPADIHGYYNEVYSHMDVAMEVFSGHADAGMGIYSAAYHLKLDFIPIAEEAYNLIIPKKHFFTPEMQALLKVIRSGSFRETALHMGGYNLADAAEIVIS